MAKLTTIVVHAESPVETVHHHLEVSVDTEGNFRVPLPDELREGAHRLWSADNDLWLDKRKWQGVAFSGYRGKARVVGKRLDDLRDFLTAVAKDHVQCEVKSELLLVYGVNNVISYWKNADGTFHPNGAYGKGYNTGDGSGWHGTLDARNPVSHYQVGFAARVVTKKTFTRPSGKKTLYYHDTGLENHHGSDLSWHAKLNGFATLDVLRDQDNTRGQDECGYERLEEGLKEMPYTEKAAHFFYDVLIGLCAMADRIEGFFANHDQVLLAIDRSLPLLLAPKDS